MFIHTRPRNAFAILLTTFSLALTMLINPSTTKATSEPITTPTPIHNAHHLGCLDYLVTNRFSGITAVVPNSGNARGASALIKIANTIDNYAECTDLWGNDGPSSWVALTPAPGNPEYNNNNAIVQIGLMNCNDPLYGICSAVRTYEPRFMYAAAGCAMTIPTALDLGQAQVNTNYRFSIRRYVDTTAGHAYGGQYLSLKINGMEKKRIWYDDPRVKCWIDLDKEVQWQTERWDAGDVVGDGSLNGVIFSDIDWYIGSTWYKVSGFPCTISGPAVPRGGHNMGCIRSTVPGLGDSLYTWTYPY